MCLLSYDTVITQVNQNQQQQTFGYLHIVCNITGWCLLHEHDISVAKYYILSGLKN